MADNPKQDSTMTTDDILDLAAKVSTPNMVHAVAFSNPRKVECRYGSVARSLVSKGLARYASTKSHGRQRLCLTSEGLAVRLILRDRRAKCICGEIAVYEGPPIYEVGRQSEAFCKTCMPLGCSCNGPNRPCVDYWFHKDGFIPLAQNEYDRFVLRSKRYAASLRARATDMERER